MEEKICKSCKYFNGQCQNHSLSRRAKTLRWNGNLCEYWKACEAESEEGEKSLKAKLLDIAIQLEKLVYELEDDE